MAHFETQLRVAYVDGRRWDVIYPLRYVRDDGVIEVPAGFTTDFASIPKLFWNVLPPVGDGGCAAYGPASVIHDWLYQTHARPRAESDAVFLEAMCVCNVGRLRRTIMYLAVRWFGWFAWRSHEARLNRLDNDDFI